MNIRNGNLLELIEWQTYFLSDFLCDFSSSIEHQTQKEQQVLAKQSISVFLDMWALHKNKANLLARFAWRSILLTSAHLLFSGIFLIWKANDILMIPSSFFSHLHSLNNTTSELVRSLFLSIRHSFLIRCCWSDLLSGWCEHLLYLQEDQINKQHVRTPIRFRT